MYDVLEVHIEYKSDDVTKNFFCISVFWIPCIGGAWWKTSTVQIGWESVHGGPRYGCHEPIHVKFGVWGFFIMFCWNIVMKMLKCKKENLTMSHFSTLLLISKWCIMGKKKRAKKPSHNAFCSFPSHNSLFLRLATCLMPNCLNGKMAIFWQVPKILEFDTGRHKFFSRIWIYIAVKKKKKKKKSWLELLP